MAFSERAGPLERLDFVILNAGVYRIEMQFNPSTGYEDDIQANYLSTILLVLLFVRIFKNQRDNLSVPNSISNRNARFEPAETEGTPVYTQH